MSVINSVLRNLQNRESHFTPIELTSVTAPAPRRRRLSPVVVAGMLLLALMAATGWIYLGQQPQRIAVAPPPAENGVVAAPAAVANPAAAAATGDAGGAESGMGETSGPTTGNQIVGLQMRESEREMRLEFELRDKVVAYLKQRGENSFAYHLRDIESRIAAPLISDNPWITNLTITAAARGVDILFETEPGILLETRQIRVDGEPVWVINLRQAAPAATAASTVEKSAAAQNPAGAAAPASTTPVAMAEQPTNPAPASTPEPPVTAAPQPESTPKPPVPAPQQPESIVKLEINSTNPGAKSANQLEYAIELIKSRRYADAENLLRQLLGGAADHGARRQLLALYAGQQRKELYRRLARESAAKYTADGNFKTEYGRSLFQAADYRAVIRLLGAETRPDSVQQALLAASYQRLDEHADAIRYYRQALAQDAGNAKNWIGLGISLEHSAQLAAALESYRHAIRIGNLSRRLQGFVERRSETLTRVLN